MSESGPIYNSLKLNEQSISLKLVLLIKLIALVLELKQSMSLFVLTLLVLPKLQYSWEYWFLQYSDIVAKLS